MQKQNVAAKYFFAGFVSSDAEVINNQKLLALPGAKKEISSITELLGSSYSIFNPALKEEFLNNASDFSILHLAMHSLVNDENPMFSVLVFSPSARDTANNRLLTALELYNMNLNSDLAVLSACNTGFGTLHRGEGIMSFARAFAYAGVPSAVISLWQVPDKATSKIMVNFYKYLKAGDSKDRALQHAKLDFIRDYPQMSAPFYWAGFILTGSKEPVKFPTSVIWYWIIATLLVAEIFLIVANRKVNIVKRTVKT
jgi:CHAT domain-containing protein